MVGITVDVVSACVCGADIPGGGGGGLDKIEVGLIDSTSAALGAGCEG